MVAESTLLDTNVLLAATEPERPGHAEALMLLGGPRSLAITPQIVREYVAVSTRPRANNGMGLRPEVATANVNTFLERCDLLAENAAVVRRQLTLIAATPPSGRQVHDANIVATALVHGITCIVTDDIRPFEHFADLIEIEALA